MALKWKRPKSCSRCNYLQFNGTGITGHGTMRCMLGFVTEYFESGVHWPNATPYEDAWVTIRPIEPCFKPALLGERVGAYKSIVYPQHRPIPAPGFEHLFNEWMPDQQ